MKTHILKLKTIISKAFARTLGLFPHKIPRDYDGLKKFGSEIFWAYDIPDELSYHRVMSSTIMQLGAQVNKASKKFLAASVKRLQINEAAYKIIEEHRSIEKAALEAAEAKKKEDAETKANNLDIG